MQFQKEDSLDLLHQSIKILREAIHTLNSADDNYSLALITLGSHLLVLYDRTGSDEDLEEAARCQREAVLITLSQGKYRFVSLTNLASVFLSHFARFGDLESLAEAVSVSRDGIRIIPAQHPSQVVAFNTLGSALHRQYRETGNIDSLDEATSYPLRCLNLSSNEDPLRIVYASNLSGALLELSKRKNDKNILLNAIDTLRREIGRVPNRSFGRAGALTFLGNALLELFSHDSQPDALDEAIRLMNEALELRPPGHPERPISLHTIANTHSHQFLYVSKDESALSAALTYFGEIFQLRSNEHPFLHETHYMVAHLLLAESSLFNREKAIYYLSEIALDQYATSRRKLQLLTKGLNWAERATNRDPSFLMSEPLLEVYKAQ